MESIVASLPSFFILALPIVFGVCCGVGIRLRPAPLIRQTDRLEHGSTIIGEARDLAGLAGQELDFDLAYLALDGGVADHRELGGVQGAKRVDAAAHVVHAQIELRGDLVHFHAVQEHEKRRVDIDLVAATASGFSSHAEQ